MLAYYRAMFRPGSRVPMRPIGAPTLVVWGERDTHLGRNLAEPSHRLVTDQRVEYLPGASHWVQHDEPERVSALLIEHFRPLQA